MRKSNVEFDCFIIRDVQRLYGFESVGKKDIIISKIYEDMEDGKTEWNGKYEIEYDGVTDVFCYIDLLNDDLAIEFVSGDSIHGSASVYELDFDDDYHREVISGIINIVLKNREFIEFCKDNLITSPNKENQIKYSENVFWKKQYNNFEEQEEIEEDLELE